MKACKNEGGENESNENYIDDRKVQNWNGKAKTSIICISGHLHKKGKE